MCSPTALDTGFSPNDGASCDDALYCTTNDVCAGTICAGAALECGDGVDCNGAEAGDEATEACVSGEVTCLGNSVCDLATDACVATCTGCVIGGSCYGAGQSNPANPCQVCDVSTNASGWTDNDGTRCDDGLYCTAADVCSGGACGGVPRDCSDAVACDGTETCDESTGRCLVGVPTCTGTEICHTASDSCVATRAGCVIGNVGCADTSTNPNNACEVCAVATSTTSWTPNDGAACDDGAFCTTSDVCSGGMRAGSTSSDFCSDGVSCSGDEVGNRCSGCNLPCADQPNSTSVCAASSCGFVCDAGYRDCSTAPGCETNVLGSDNAN